MAFLTIEELKTHLYPESRMAISGTDDTIVQAAIDAGIAEAKGYLAAYDTAVAFGAEGTERNALLLLFVKDIAVWHYVNLCNAGVEMELRLKRYERAVDWLKAVQRGDVTPDLPRPEDANGKPAGGNIIFGSNPKKEQHY